MINIKKLPHNHSKNTNHFLNKILDNDVFNSVSDLLKIMSDEKRLQIFWLLCHTEECLINISSAMEMTSPNVFHHLKILKNAGLVINRRIRKEVYYTAAKTNRTKILHEMIENMIEFHCPSDKSFNKKIDYDSQIEKVHEIHSLLISDLSKQYTTKQLSEKFNINQTTLKTTFKTVFGQSIGRYMQKHKIKIAMEYLSTTNLSIQEISKIVGYKNASKFTYAFKKLTGIIPKEYRKMNSIN